MEKPVCTMRVRDIVEQAATIRSRIPDWNWSHSYGTGEISIEEAFAVLACDESPVAQMALSLLRSLAYRLATLPPAPVSNL